MKNLSRYIAIGTALIAIGLEYTHAQAPKYSNEFLSIGVGARALGMSNSTVASTDDVSSGYWNPAGLSRIQSNIQVGLMHSEYFAGIAKYDYGSLAARIDTNSAFGISVIRFGVDDIPNTTELIDNNGNIDYERITSFSAVDYGFLLSYSRKASFLEGLRYGANAKIIHRAVGDFAKSWGFGIDLGAQYDINTWRFGVMARDATSTGNSWSFNLSDDMKEVFAATGNEIPENSFELTLPRFLFGVAKTFTIKDKVSILAEADMDITTDGQRNVLIGANTLSADPHLGLEIGYKKLIYLRAGIGNFQKIKDLDGQDDWTFQPNMGLGVKFKRIALDYALTDIGDQSVALFSNVFSLRFDITKEDK